ncbi:MAG: cytochrome c [Acidobacteria bacterium]|nr:cytochrome c [Acidobacteriota bacterium]
MKTNALKLFAVLFISAESLALLAFSASGQTVGAFASSKARTGAAALFDAKCAMCHGKDGRGTKFGKEKGAPDFTESEWQKSHTDAQINDAITNGRGKSMPAWKNKLSSEEITALVARVREFAGKH